MYKITVNKITYTHTTRGTKRNQFNIFSVIVPLYSLTEKMIELKRRYKDFSYNIEFERL